MVGIETLVVHIDCLQELVEVIFLVRSGLEVFLAHTTVLVQNEPLLDTFTMEDVITVKHPTNGIVCNCL